MNSKQPDNSNDQKTRRLMFLVYFMTAMGILLPGLLFWFFGMDRLAVFLGFKPLEGCRFSWGWFNL